MLDESIKEWRSVLGGMFLGIVNDSKNLVGLELALMKSEASRELEKAKVFSTSLVIAIAAALISLILAAFCLVYFIASMVPTLELWQSYGIAALLFSAIAIAFVFKSRKTAAAIDFSLPKTRESIKEVINV